MSTKSSDVAPVRLGIIGFGKMGQIRMEAAIASGLGNVVGIYDPFAPRQNKIKSYASAEDLLADSEIDAVIIATPNDQNCPLTIAAMENGKHVFCEKPPAFTALEVEEIRRVERVTKRKLMYGFNHRHHESIRTIKRLVESGRYGRLLWMRGRYGKSVDHNYFNTWRAKKEVAGGGILLDQGIHMLDLFLFLAGEFDEVQGMVSNLFWKLDGIEDNVFVNLRNRSTGVVASLHSTMTQWRHLFSIEVFLEQGYMVLNGLKTSSGSYGDEVLTIAKNRSVAPAATWEDEEKTTFHLDNSWLDETRYFLSCIRNNETVQSGNSTDALKVMRIIDIVYQEERHSCSNLKTRLHTE